MTGQSESAVAEAGEPFTAEISRHVWDSKYRYRSDGRNIDHTLDDGWQRIARAMAAAEPMDRPLWHSAFRGILEDFHFLPGGRIQSGAGTRLKVTLLNCFVMGTVEDSMDGIFRALHEGAITMQQGGGVGYDFSTLRPRGTPARGVGAIASGPVSFMALWDVMCEAVLSMGSRRGAMMGTLRCDHPDIEAFVAAKQRPGALRHFNLSVQVTDAFMQAVRSDADWDLVFPANPAEAGGDLVLREWPGHAGAVPCRVHRRLRARELWRMVLRCAYDHGEPGVLFIDCINRTNNLAYCERITATNPCGEVPLPPYGACDLGSINLTKFVREPFGPNARFEEGKFSQTAEIATRFLDNVIDTSRFPLRQQAAAARRTRRIGLGITGLADALIMLGLDYGSEEARAMAAHIICLACLTAYRTSVRLSAEKGSFPAFVCDSYLASPFISALPIEIRDGIAQNGIRNSHLLAIAPTGSISLLANNVSSGIEPVFADLYGRKVLDAGGTTREFALTDYAVALWQDERSKSQGRLPPAFRSITDLSAREHLLMQAALQPFVDNAISKTINVVETYPFEDFCEIYDEAYDLGLKGCTTFRLSPAQAAILTAENDWVDAPHCCAMEREAD
jgi:ribonucleoside-diphosphate reductase alpha chain